MKPIKKLVAALVVVILSTTIILWSLTKSMKPETVKSYLNLQLTSLTAQNSRIDGDISWHLFPRPGIKITHVQIGDEHNPFNYSVKIENLLFNLKITSIFAGKLVFNEINVDGFKILVNPVSPVLQKNHPQFKATSNVVNPSSQFAIERFLLSHGQITIKDSKRKIYLSRLQIGAEQFNLQKKIFPFQFKSNFEITEASNKIFKTFVNFKGSISLTPALFSNPLIALQNTVLDGQLALKNFKLNRFKIAKISAHAQTKPGVISLNPLSLNLYNGESVGDLNFEYASKKLIINQTATNLDGSKFIKDLLSESLFKGSLDLSIHAQANLEKDNWLESTTGNGSFTIKNGLIESVNLDRVVTDTSDKISNLFAGQSVEKSQPLNLALFNNPEFFRGGTPFNLLTFHYQLKDEKLQSNSIVLQTKTLQLKGDGNLNLGNKSINSNLFVRVIFFAEGINRIQQFLGGSFPIMISGTLNEPKVVPDLQKINPILTQIWLKGKLIKPVKTIGKTLHTILKNGQQLL